VQITERETTWTSKTGVLEYSHAFPPPHHPAFQQTTHGAREQNPRAVLIFPSGVLNEMCVCVCACVCTLQGTAVQAPQRVRQDLDFWPSEWQGALLRGSPRGLPRRCGARSVPIPRGLHAAAVVWGRGGGNSEVLHRAQACQSHGRKELNVQVCGCRNKRWLLSPCILWEHSRGNPDVLLGSQEDGPRGPRA
jgi:hypothetical protein